MANCRQACLYNTFDGCKVKEYAALCPLANTATPVAEYRATNADRIRAMSDEELAVWMAECNAYGERADASQWLPWLKEPAEDGHV